MTLKDSRTSRRSFFLQGGAALGAGVAATAGAAMLPASQGGEASGQIAKSADREAIRQLHIQFTSLMESHGYEATAALFEPQAQVDFGATGAIHDAYRANSLQRHDSLQFTGNGQRASATWHVDVATGMPPPGNCTAEQMARLQGLLSDRHWESGRIEATYAKSLGVWKIAALRYTPV